MHTPDIKVIISIFRIFLYEYKFNNTQISIDIVGISFYNAIFSDAQTLVNFVVLKDLFFRCCRFIHCFSTTVIWSRCFVNLFFLYKVKKAVIILHNFRWGSNFFFACGEFFVIEDYLMVWKIKEDLCALEFPWNITDWHAIYNLSIFVAKKLTEKHNAHQE